MLVAHDVPERSAIRIEPGDQVEVGDTDSDWPEFVFVTTAAGGGWVPARHLLHAGGRATVLTAYDTTELSTTAGERLEVIVRDRRSGWTWCRNSAGSEGWVPDRTLEWR